MKGLYTPTHVDAVACSGLAMISWRLMFTLLDVKDALKLSGLVTRLKRTNSFGTITLVSLSLSDSNERVDEVLRLSSNNHVGDDIGLPCYNLSFMHRLLATRRTSVNVLECEMKSVSAPSEGIGHADSRI